MYKSGRSAWCRNTELSDHVESETTKEAAHGRYVLHQVATRSEVQILPPQNISFHGLTFSPDSNYVYFVRTDPNDPFFKYLYVMPTLGGKRPAAAVWTGCV
jgi:hypothetical protein